jgi:hypothetical protein
MAWRAMFPPIYSIIVTEIHMKMRAIRRSQWRTCSGLRWIGRGVLRLRSIYRVEPVNGH